MCLLSRDNCWNSVFLQKMHLMKKFLDITVHRTLSYNLMERCRSLFVSQRAFHHKKGSFCLISARRVNVKSWFNAVSR
jgi:hypothetical protein